MRGTKPRDYWRGESFWRKSLLPWLPPDCKGRHLPIRQGSVFCPFPPSAYNLCLCLLLGEECERWCYHSNQYRKSVLKQPNVGREERLWAVLVHSKILLVAVFCSIGFKCRWFSCRALVSRNTWLVPEAKMPGTSGLLLAQGERKGQTMSGCEAFFLFLKGGGP